MSKVQDANNYFSGVRNLEIEPISGKKWSYLYFSQIPLFCPITTVSATD